MFTVSRHIILWIVALSILNSSVDVLETFVSVSPATHDGKSTGQHQEYDAIESITELVFDEVTDHKQHVPDSPDKEQKGMIKKPVAFDFSLPVKKEKLISPFTIHNANGGKAVSDFAILPAGFILVFSPPPDHC